MGGNVAENLSNQSVPEAAARVAAVVNRLVNRIGSNAESKERLAKIEIPRSCATIWRCSCASKTPCA